MAPIQYHQTRQSAANHAVAVLALIDPTVPTQRVKTAKRKGEERYFAMLRGDDGAWRPIDACDIRPTQGLPDDAPVTWAAFREGVLIPKSVTTDREELFFEANGDWVGCELRPLTILEASKE